MSIPTRYLPKSLTRKDRKKQKTNIIKSRSLYKKGKYIVRPKLSSFHSKPSGHVQNAKDFYNVDTILPTDELVKKTQCSRKTLKKILQKGEGAYYSSGSRPNQTPQSWGVARLASAITGGNASSVDYHLLVDGCKKTSPALKMATKTCKRRGKCQKYLS